MGSGADLQTTLSSASLETDRPNVRVRQLHVVFAPKPCETSLVGLVQRPLVIGRAPGVDGGLELPDGEASRQHARVELGTEGWTITDLGSRNGVWVDGHAVQRTVLAHGNVIRIGTSLLVFVDVEIRAGQRLAVERDGLLGRSLAMQRVRGEIDLVAPQPVSVMILGETGVGKERVAESIHRASGVRGKFVPINCAAIPSNLAESELFGHVAGAFTGASKGAEGLFTAAHEGTLFLDEIGELGPPVQAKLLRALATGEIRAVGSSDIRKVDVRVVAATHRPLDAKIADGTFRADLWARLAAWTIDVPPLRERREDVLLLAHAFVDAVALSPTAAEALLLHDWPFNVRELENLMKAAAVRASEGVIRAEHLPAPLAARIAHRTRKAAGTVAPPIETQIDRSRPPTRDELERVLRHCGGSIAQTAAFFDKDRKQIYRWLERHEIDVDRLDKA